MSSAVLSWQCDRQRTKLQLGFAPALLLELRVNLRKQLIEAVARHLDMFDMLEELVFVQILVAGRGKQCDR